MYIYPCNPGHLPRLPLPVSSGRNIFTPGTLLADSVQQPLLKVGRVGFAKSCSNLIGQPFYKGRRILRRVTSVAGASAAATLVPTMGGGVPSLGPPRPRNPVEGNGGHTRLKGLSHLIVDCVLCILYNQNTIELTKVRSIQYLISNSSHNDH